MAAVEGYSGSLITMSTLLPCSKPLASPVGPCRALPRRPLRVLAAHSPTRQSPVNSDTAAKFCGLAAAGLLLLGHPGVAAANASKVAEFAASGLIFKDSVELLALDDKEGKQAYYTGTCSRDYMAGGDLGGPIESMTRVLQLRA